MRFRFEHLICCLAMFAIAGCGKSLSERRLEAELSEVEAKLAALQDLSGQATKQLLQASAQLSVSTKQLNEFGKIADSRSLGNLDELTELFTTGDYQNFKVDSVDGRMTLLKHASLNLVISLTSADGRRVIAAQIMMRAGTQEKLQELEKIGKLTRFAADFDESVDQDLVLDMLVDVDKNKKLGLMFVRFSKELMIDAYGTKSPTLTAVRVRRRPDAEKTAQF